jgi:hypothetical protein
MRARRVALAKPALERRVGVTVVPVRGESELIGREEVP